MTLSPLERHLYGQIERRCRRFFDHRAKLPLELFLSQVDKAHGYCKAPRSVPVGIIDDRSFRWNPTVLEDAWSRMLIHHEQMLALKHLTPSDQERFASMSGAERGRCIGLGHEVRIQTRHLKRLGYRGANPDAVLSVVRDCENCAAIKPSALAAAVGGATVYGEGPG